MSALASVDEIIAYWFGNTDDTPDSAAVVAARSALWWGKDAAIDRELKARFEATLLAASQGQLDEWAETARGLLALILLLDQMPRNCYRDSPRAFAFDELARQCCHLGLAQGFDQQLPPLQRVFFYLPLEHAEDLDDQEYSLQLFRALSKQVSTSEPTASKCFANFLDFARQHHAIIDRFGRFPHRNAILARASTADESAFLLEPHSSF